jgi:hypothetical protein
MCVVQMAGPETEEAARRPGETSKPLSLRWVDPPVSQGYWSRVKGIVVSQWPWLSLLTGVIFRFGRRGTMALSEAYAGKVNHLIEGLRNPARLKPRIFR